MKKKITSILEVASWLGLSFLVSFVLMLLFLGVFRTETVSGVFNTQYTKIQTTLNKKHDQKQINQLVIELKQSFPSTSIDTEEREHTWIIVTHNKEKVKRLEIINFIRGKNVAGKSFSWGNQISEIFTKLNSPKKYKSDLVESIQPIIYYLISALPISFLGIALFIRKRKKIVDKPLTGNGLKMVLLGLSGGVLILLISFLVEIILSSFGWNIQEQGWLVFTIKNMGHSPVMFLVICVVVPIAEELFFRGCIFSYLKETHNFKFGLITSTILFSFAHFNPTAFILYVLYGSFFAFIYHKTNSLIPCIMMHALINTTAYISLFFF